MMLEKILCCFLLYSQCIETTLHLKALTDTEIKNCLEHIVFQKLMFFKILT